MLSDVAAMTPEATLFVGGMVTLVGGSFTPRRSQWRMRVVAALAATTALVLALRGLSSSSRSTFEGTFEADYVTGMARVAVTVALLLVLAMCGGEIAGHPRESETYSLMLFGATGALLLAGTTDLTLLLVAFLLTSVPLYALIGIIERPASAEAALKTYLLGALLGIVMMLGVTLLVAIAGGSGYQALASTPNQDIVTVGAVLVLAGLLFEAGAVPAHFWVPDAAQGTSTTAAAYLTTVPKIGALVALARFVDQLPGDRWMIVVGVLAAASMTIGNLAAFAQTDPRRLIGWSTVSQVGYLLVPVAVIGQDDLAVPALLYYLLAYAVTNIGVFAVIAAVPSRVDLASYAGIGRRSPLLATALVVLLLGLLGTPPTAVFIGKLTGSTAAWDGGLAWLVVVLALNSLLSLFYYLRWIAPALAKAPPTSGIEGEQEGIVPDVPFGWAFPTAVAAAALSVLLGVGAGAIWAGLSGTTLG